MMRYKQTKHGFTLVELLVSIAITVGMLAIISQVYESTGRAVSRGVGLSHIIANNRGINTKITRDSENMVGPGGQGFLVIANHTITAEMPDSADDAQGRNWTKDPLDHHKHIETIRDDQIVFVRNPGGKLNSPGVGPVVAHPLMDVNDEAYDATYNASTGYIIVWYGHAARTNRYGNFKNPPLNPPDLGVRLVSGKWGRPNPLNSLASQWILGRQAMFLSPGGTGTLPYSNSPLPVGTVTWASTPTNGYANGMGTSDVAHFSYVSSPPLITTDYVVGSTATPSALSPILNANTTKMTHTQYQTEAFTFLYAGNNRLRVDPSPIYDTSDASYQYEPWQIAQMHGALAVNVSDFEIAFAADIMNNGASSISYAPDGNIDRVSDALVNTLGGASGVVKVNGMVVLSAGSIMWYVSPGFQNTPNDGTSNHGAGFDANEPVTFAAPTTYPPQGSPSGEFTTGFYGGFVWRHDDTGGTYIPGPAPKAQSSNWPYLIRIRYRMHDSQGRVTSGFHRQGVWFEHIIRVPR